MRGTWCRAEERPYLIFLALATMGPAQSPPALVDRTEAWGIDQRHVTGASGVKYMVETMGSGAAFFDYDLDGDADLYLAQGGRLPGFVSHGPISGELYRNDGRRFVRVSEQAGVVVDGYGMGAVTGDIDNDGDPDLYVSQFGPNLLFLNNGDGTFSEIGQASGVDDRLWGASAAFSDLDNDGDLDLYVTNYLDWSLDNNPDCSQRKNGEVLKSYCLPDVFRGQPDALFENLDGRGFRLTESAGVARNDGKSLGVVAFDYDDDGWIDVYVANDTVPNFLFHNEGGLRFENVGLETGTAYDHEGNALAGMGVDVSDYDRDADLDLFVTNFQGEANTLYRYDGGGFFTDVSFEAGVGRPSLNQLGFGAVFADLDNDGWEDLVIANGHVLDNVERLYEGSTHAQPNQIFRNVRGRFEPWTEALGASSSEAKVSRGLATADVDGDGDLDVIVTNSGDETRLLENQVAGGRSARIRLIGTTAPRDGTGARLRVLTDDGTWVTTVTAGSSYLSDGERVVHIGLGSALGGRAAIRWPGSSEEAEPFDVAPQEEIVVLQGHGIVARRQLSR